MGEKINAYRFLVRKPVRKEERNHLEDPGIETRAVFRGVGAMEWIYLAQCKDKRRALVNTSMNTWIA